MRDEITEIHAYIPKYTLSGPNGLNSMILYGGWKLAKARIRRRIRRKDNWLGD
jgi:hypothetical protein